MSINTSDMDFNEFVALFMPGPGFPSASVLKISNINMAVLIDSNDSLCDELMCGQCNVTPAIFRGCPHGESLVARITRKNRYRRGRSEGHRELLRTAISFYPNCDVSEAAYVCMTTNDASPTRWAWVSSFVSVKATEDTRSFKFDYEDGRSDDAETSQSTGGDNGIEPARDPGKLPDGTVFSADSALEQMADYASKIFQRQHRLNFFALVVFKAQARVVRWDRAGAIVSTPIDFERDPSLLHQVIWRYACLNQEQHGFQASSWLPGLRSKPCAPARVCCPESGLLGASS
ncbi:hypothetical protein DAEQUDRAFT_757614 [Daedalea quercina L-15889]|uniref:Fungal-type protein kinase domain-containing protein n=1 Tax=Daedalea quercina L-15889 TaxID=1314783 RepID=A0A165PMF5_9APHY|nr:hypothetical protein DAEQUDRAFT_757614 [Daedalea quercina L-15889]